MNTFILTNNALAAYEREYYEYISGVSEGIGGA